MQPLSPREEIMTVRTVGSKQRPSSSLSLVVATLLLALLAVMAIPMFGAWITNLTPKTVQNNSSAERGD